MEGWTDGRTLFYRTLLAEARGPINLETILLKWKRKHFYQFSYIQRLSKKFSFRYFQVNSQEIHIFKVIPGV